MERMVRRRAHLRALTFATLTLASSLPAGRGHEIVVESHYTRIVEGQVHIRKKCYYVGHVYSPFLIGAQANTTAENHTVCQKRCQTVAQCEFFTFFRDAKQCRLAGPSAVFRATAVTAAGRPTTALGLPIAGPRMCPGKFPRGCTEMPGPAFPGVDKIGSQLAFPSHRVPQNLECWPKNWTRGVYGKCAHVTVLESTATTGWPGKCLGLREVLTPYLQSCESYCKKKITCSVFQEVQLKKPFGPKTCWHGDRTAGQDCYERKPDPDFQPLRAKRFKRGTVRVLADLQGVEILGLVNTFPETYFLSVADAAIACRYHCYSNIFCQYWQYLLASGCWTEDPGIGSPVPFPPTTQVWTTGSLRARTAVAGEYVQHLCFDEGEAASSVKHHWETVEEEASCPSELLRDLGSGVVKVDNCMHLAIADVDCSKEVLSDGWNCWCVVFGKVCSPTSGNATLFKHSMKRRESKFHHFAKSHPGRLKDRGYKRMPTLKPHVKTKRFEVTLTLRGLEYKEIGETQMVLLVSSFSNAAAAALEVPSTSVHDLRHNCGSVNIFHGARPNSSKVSFTVLERASMTDADLRQRLLNSSFNTRIAQEAQDVVPHAVSGGIEVLVAVGRRGTHLPGHRAKYVDDDPEPHLSWSPLWLLVLPCGASIAGGLCLATRDPLEEVEGDSSDEKEQPRRSRVQAREVRGGDIEVPQYAPLR